MKQTYFKIISNENIAESVFKMELKGDTSEIFAPGQFVNIKLDGMFLRRPISVCDYDDNKLTIIYKVVGSGTEKMSEMNPGEELDILVGLGNGYNTRMSGDKPLLIGGGVGVPPLYRLCRDLISEGKSVTVVLGFNTAKDVFYVDEFMKLGADVRIATADGSCGMKGFVTDAMTGIDYTYFYACGPEPMLRAVKKATVTSGQLSFEERMGCGFGACMGCTCETVTGGKRICTEGPVLEKEEILWED